MPGTTVDNPLVFVSIAPDGQVTIVAHRAEMGTGVRTSLPMVVADEMEARWDRVKIEQAVADETRYGNQNVDGSRSMRHFLMPMRRVGAAARQMLEAAAAARWGVPVAQVKAVQHEVIHTASGKRLGFGELAADAAKQAVPMGDQLRLKKRPTSAISARARPQPWIWPISARARPSTAWTSICPAWSTPSSPVLLCWAPGCAASRAKALQVAGVKKVLEIPG